MNTVAYSPQERTRTFLSILLFAALAFLITWGIGMAVVLSTHADLVNGARQVQHPIRLPLAVAITLIVIGGYGPALAAIAVTAWHSGRSGVRDLLSQFRRWRVHPIWFAAALLGPALLGLISLCLTSLSGASTPRHWLSLPRPLRFLGWAFGPWGEELGWRGYAQPKLQQRLGSFWSSLIVGLIWSCWHYWPVVTPAGAPFRVIFSTTFATWLTYEMANSVLMAWLYNSTRGSLPIAWAAHAGLNLGQNLVNAHPIPFGSFVLVFCAAALLVAALGRRRTLPRSSQKEEAR